MPSSLKPAGQSQSGLKQRAAQAGVNLAYDTPFEGWRAAYYEDVHRLTRHDYANGRFVTAPVRDLAAGSDDEEELNSRRMSRYNRAA